MEHYIEKPNLPQGKVSLAVVSSEYPEIVKGLHDFGIRTLTVGAHPDLPLPVSHHADMVFCHLGGNKAVCDTGQTDLISSLKNEGFDVSLCRIGSTYPGDCMLNVCRTPQGVICGAKTPPSPAANENERLKVRQGYAKCSVCVVNETSLITDDESIYSALGNRFDILKLRKGAIRLRGHDYGFIGGCTGKLDRDVLAFCGDVSLHPDAVQIKAFLAERGMISLSLYGGELIDIGSVLPITEHRA